jgi:hypothetical protein
MKSKILFLSTLTLGLAAVVAGGMAPKQAVRARAELDPSKTYVDHYLARYVNQDDIPVSSGANFTIPSFDPTSTLTFTGNYGKYEANHSAFRLGSYGSADDLPQTTSKSINNAGSGVFKEIYDDIKTIATNKYNVAMVSDQYIENIQDIAIFWNELPENSAEAKSYLRIVYLTDDSDKMSLEEKRKEEKRNMKKRIKDNKYMKNDEFLLLLCLMRKKKEQMYENNPYIVDFSITLDSVYQSKKEEDLEEEKELFNYFDYDLNKFID